MKKIHIFANYGMLAHEKTTVYSAAHGEIYDRITVALPEGWEPVELIGGQGLESPWGSCYFVDDVITCIGDHPWIDVINVNNGEEYRKKLHIIQKGEE